LRARYCNTCGQLLQGNRAKKDPKGRTKLHADIAHPINAVCRQRIQRSVVEAFKRELELSKQPGYQPVEMETDDDY
jgi:stage V sporulation protein G